MAAPRAQLIASLAASRAQVRHYERTLYILRNRGHGESIDRALEDARREILRSSATTPEPPEEPTDPEPEPRYYSEANLYEREEGTIPVPECPDCGALVTDTGLHNAWHERTKS